MGVAGGHSALRIETHRLGELLRDPTGFCVRRVERLSFTHGRRYRWDVTNEIRIPVLDIDSDEQTRALRIVSLGVYEKIQYPDLIVMDGSEQRLPVLSRKERALLLGDLFLRDHVAHVDAPNPVLKVIKSLINLVIFMPPLQARWVADQLSSYVAESRYGLLKRTKFEQDLQLLVESRHILAYIPASPGETVLTRHQYSEDFRYEATNPIGRPRLVHSLGMVPSQIVLSNLNVGRAASYHLVVEAPEGLCIEDIRWLNSIPRGTGGPTTERANVVRGTVVTLDAHRYDVDIASAPPGIAAPAKPRRARAAFARGLTTVAYAVGFFVGIVRSRRGGSQGGREYMAEFGVQVHPRSVVRFAAAVLVALFGAFVTIVLQVGELQLIQEDAAAATLVAVPGLAAVALSQQVSRAAARFVGSLRWLLVLGSLGAFICAGLIAFHLPVLMIVALASAGGGLSMAGALTFVYAGFSNRARPSSQNMDTWRANRERNASRYLFAYAVLGASASVVLLGVGIDRAA